MIQRDCYGKNCISYTSSHLALLDHTDNYGIITFQCKCYTVLCILAECCHLQNTFKFSLFFIVSKANVE